MGEMIFDLLKSFGFTEHQSIITLVSILALLSNFLGGIMNSLFLAYGGPQTKVKLTQRLSFRMFLATEVVVGVFAFYYHALMVNMVTISHVVYWGAAMVLMPFLAVIGSQIVHVIYDKRISQNFNAGKKRKRNKPVEADNPADIFLKSKDKF